MTSIMIGRSEEQSCLQLVIVKLRGFRAFSSHKKEAEIVREQKTLRLILKKTSDLKLFHLISRCNFLLGRLNQLFCYQLSRKSREEVTCSCFALLRLNFVHLFEI